MLEQRLREKFEDQLSRCRELEEKIADPTVISGDPLYADYLREHGSLAKILAPFQRMLLQDDRNSDTPRTAKATERIRRLLMCEPVRADGPEARESGSLHERTPAFVVATGSLFDR